MEHKDLPQFDNYLNALRDIKQMIIENAPTDMMRQWNMFLQTYDRNEVMAVALQAALFSETEIDTPGELLFRGYFYEHIGDLADEAIDHYQKAADLGNQEAFKALIRILNKKINDSESSTIQESALEWIEKAANLGFSEAQVLLGDIYDNPKGTAVYRHENAIRTIEFNHQTAVDWYQKATGNTPLLAQAKLMVSSWQHSNNYWEKYERTSYYYYRCFENLASLYRSENVAQFIDAHEIERIGNAMAREQHHPFVVYYRGKSPELDSMAEDNPKLLATIIARTPDHDVYERDVRPLLRPDLAAFYETYDDLLHKQWSVHVSGKPVLPASASENKSDERTVLKNWLTTCMDALSDPDLFPEYKKSGAMSYLPIFNKEKYADKKNAIRDHLKMLRDTPDKYSVESCYDQAYKALEDFWNTLLHDDWSSYFNTDYKSNIAPLNRYDAPHIPACFKVHQEVDRHFERKLSFSSSEICYIYAGVLLSNNRMNAAKKWLLKATNQNYGPAISLLKSMFPDTNDADMYAKISILDGPALYTLGKVNEEAKCIDLAASFYHRAVNENHHGANAALQTLAINHPHHPAIMHHLVAAQAYSGVALHPDRIFIRFHTLVHYAPDQMALELLHNQYGWKNIAYTLYIYPERLEKFLDELDKAILDQMVLIRAAIHLAARTGFSNPLIDIISQYIILHEPMKLPPPTPAPEAPSPDNKEQKRPAPPSPDEPLPKATLASYRAHISQDNKAQDSQRHELLLETLNRYANDLRQALPGTAGDIKINAEGGSIAGELKLIINKLDELKKPIDIKEINAIRAHLSDFLNLCRNYPQLAQVCERFNSNDLRNLLSATEASLTPSNHTDHHPRGSG